MSHQNLPGIGTAARAAEGVWRVSRNKHRTNDKRSAAYSCKMKPANHRGGYARLMKGVDRDCFALVSRKAGLTGYRSRSDILKRKETWTRDRHAAWEMLAFVGRSAVVARLSRSCRGNVGFPVDGLSSLTSSCAKTFLPEKRRKSVSLTNL